MAYTSIIPVRRLDRAVDYIRDKSKTTMSADSASSLEEAVDYARNQFKTANALYETGIGVVCEDAFEQMKLCKQRWKKMDGVQGYHLIQSFAAGEVTPALAHQIGVELAEKILGGRYQCVITTHLNTDHIHNHLVWNSVAMDTGRKYHSNAKSYYMEVRKSSDDLCRKYGLSVIQSERAAQQSAPYYEWLDEKEGKLIWKDAIRQDIDEAIAGAVTWMQFLKALEAKGYTLKLNRKYISLCPPGKDRFVRFKTLGKRYTPEAIQQRILYPSRLPSRNENQLSVRRVRIRGNLQNCRRLTGLQALYYRYLYELGALPRKPKRSSYAVREDIRNLEKRVQQMDFLIQHNIHTLAQLEEYHQPLAEKITQLTKKRYYLYHAQPDSPDIAKITAKLKLLRREEKLCRKIKEQSPQMGERLRTAQRERCRQLHREQEKQSKSSNFNRRLETTL